MSDLEERLRKMSPAQREAFLARLKERKRKKAAGAPTAKTVVKQEYADQAPLSSGQKQMWIEHQKGGFYSPHPVMLRGPLDADVLRKAIAALVDRHEVLRTTFPVLGGTPVQRILPKMLDEQWRSIVLKDSSDLRGAIQAEVVSQPLHLDKSPPFRALLCRTAPDIHVLVLLFHHIAIDAWGIGVAMNELEEFYRAGAHNEAHNLPATTLQVADYAIWEEQRLQQPDLEPTLAWWTEQLADMPRSGAWPGDDPKDGSLKFTSFEVGGANTLSQLASKAQAAAIASYLAAVAILVRELTGQNDVVIGMPIAGRDRPEFAQLLGMMVHTLPIAIRTEGAESFAGLLEDVAHTWKEAMKRQWMPFDRIVRAAAVDRQGARAPLFDILLNWIPVGETKQTFADLVVVDTDDDGEMSSLYQLLLTVEAGPTVRFSFGMNAERFAGPLGETLVAVFARILDQCANEPNRPLREWEIASEDERRLFRQRRLDIDGLRRQLADLLPAAAIPSQFILIDELPRLPSGKVDRRSLPSPQELGPRRAASPPSTLNERLIAQVWSEILQVDVLDIHDNFFQIGGHSLLGVRAQHQLSSATSVQIPLMRIFESPTIAELAAWLDDQVVDAGEGITARAHGDEAPVSSEQRRMWFLQKLHPRSVSYQVPIATRLHGTVDIELLSNALTSLVARHEVLRTQYPERDGEPFQRITPAPATLPISIVDLSAVGDAQAAVRAQIAAQVAIPFRLEQEIPIRVALYRLGPEEFVLLVLIHHIAIDAWSTGILMRELSQLYAAGRRSDLLPAPPLQYADYAIWQKEQLESPRLAEGLSFWADQLDGAKPTIDWPVVIEGSSGAGGHDFKFSSQASASLLSLARKEGVTSFTLLYGLFTAFVARYTQQRDVTIGVPVTLRERHELQSVVGLMLNTLPMRTSVPVNATFRDWLTELSELWQSAMPHQWVPLEDVVQAVAADHSSQHLPLFDAMFVVTPPQGEDGAFDEGLSVSTFHGVELPEAKLPLLVGFSEETGRIVGNFEYDRRFFDDAAIEGMVRALATFAEVCGEQPDRPLLANGIVDEDEIDARQSFGVGRTAPLSETSVTTMFERRASEHPDETAVIDGNGALSFGELDRRSNRIAHQLLAMGVCRGESVAIDLGRTLNLVTAVLGVLKAGAAVVPLTSALPRNRLNTILDSAAAKLVIIDDTRRAAYEDFHTPTWNLDVPLDLDTDGSPAVAITSDDLACVIFTSGSTGKPKGVAMVHATFQTLLDFHARSFPLRRGDVVLQKTPFVFDVAMWELLAPVSFGARLIIPPENVHRDPRRMLSLMTEHAVSHLQAVPTQLQLLLEEVERTGTTPPLRYVASAGEVLTPELANRVRRLLPDVVLQNIYGPTETYYTTYWTMPAGEVSEVPIGRPLPNYRTEIVDSLGNLSPRSVPGELVVGGIGLARGYAGEAGLTAARFLPDPLGAAPGSRMYRTGDVVRWNDSGELLYVGRDDRQIKLRGQRIELDEIERIIEVHQDVRRCAVAAHKVNGRYDRLTAWVEPRSGTRPTVEELREHVAAAATEYMVPATITVVEQLPRTATGKIDRNKLSSEKLAPDESRELVLPRTPREARIAALFCDLLTLGEVGIHQNFFDLGGHSFLAVKLQSRVEDEFEIVVQLELFFTHGSVAGLANIIARGEAGHDLGHTDYGMSVLRAGDSPIVLIPPSGSLFAYRPLVEALDGHGVVGIVPDESAASLEAIAEQCASELARGLTTRSCSLCGWSFGGVLAFAVVEPLRRLGVDVEHLFLIDSYAPELFARGSARPGIVEFAAHVGASLGLDPGRMAAKREELLALEDDLRFAWLSEALVELSAGQIDADVDALEALYNAHARRMDLYRDYRPSSLDTPATLFVASADPGPRGWDTLTRPAPTIVEMPTHHYEVVNGVHAQQIASRIGRTLRTEED